MNAFSVICPGCGRTVDYRATANLVLRWGALPDGRRLGYLVAVEAGAWEYGFGKTRGASRGLGGRHLSEDWMNNVVDIIHECAAGGGAGDRAALPPPRPTRLMSAELPEPT